eukprot:TRINITY_DN5493_c0_g1_i1.p8 TRINITY_DN5493_c0_g1~~TRINITY_DN5493_c0_g1_i1.p8  ORF type:complete len:112 (+),score=35.97 TRINITY_DN5493_c0_g1_i1:384-719(+)
MLHVLDEEHSIEFQPQQTVQEIIIDIVNEDVYKLIMDRLVEGSVWRLRWDNENGLPALEFPTEEEIQQKAIMEKEQRQLKLNQFKVQEQEEEEEEEQEEEEELQEIDESEL